MTKLSYADIQRMAKEPSPEIRGLLASKIASDFRGNYFSEAEEAVANDIFRILIKDTNSKIRRAVAEQLAHCKNTPHDIITLLASDEVEVSSPVLRYSSVLTEEDLVSIIHSTHEVIKLCAIANRETLSSNISGKLIEKSIPMVLQNLFKNTGAEITPEQMNASWELISTSPTLIETLVQRGGLSLTIAEKLYHVASEELRRGLQAQYNISSPSVHKAISDAKEWAVLGLVTEGNRAPLADDETVEDFVDGLHYNNRLTHSLLIRALCTGHLGIFEYGLAKMADVPRLNARILLMETSGRGLDAIYRAANMPEGFFEAVKILLRLSLEETDFGRTHHNDFCKRVIERVYIGKYNRTVENMEYMLSIIGGKKAATSNVH
jgi:uncharacterized protein (DUF2336 family)